MRRMLLLSATGVVAVASLSIGCTDGDGGDVTSTAEETGNMTRAAKIVGQVECGSDNEGAYARGKVENVSLSTWAFQVVAEFRDRNGDVYIGAEFQTPDVAPGH